MSVTGTPGRWALRCREGAAWGGFRVPRCGIGGAAATGLDDHNGTGIDGAVKGGFEYPFPGESDD